MEIQRERETERERSKEEKERDGGREREGGRGRGREEVGAFKGTQMLFEWEILTLVLTSIVGNQATKQWKKMQKKDMLSAEVLSIVEQKILSIKATITQ